MMEWMESGMGRRVLIVIAVGSIILAAGLGYTYLVSKPPSNGGVAAVPDYVGIIRIDGTILDEMTNGAGSAINEAVENSSVKAVVLVIESPGGYAHQVERLYLDLLELKKSKPVVASVSTALSGGYYVAVAADYIYAHPSSMVGNVGVIATGPDNLLPSEKSLETGPYKITGFSRLLFPFNLSHTLENFAGAVEEGRGDRLKLSPTELRRGLIYMGTEAVGNGLVDEIGSVQRATEHAAQLAGLVEYRTADLSEGVEGQGGASTGFNGTRIAWRDLTISALNELNPPPAIYYLYLPPAAYEDGGASVVSVADGGNETVPPQMVKGQVVVDLSHGNKVSPWVFDLLAAELAARGVFVGYATTWDQLESALQSASCLIVAAPTEFYSYDEFKAIDEWAKEGRVLLLFSDPSGEFTDVPELLGPINSLANRYSLSFGKGYLYNEGDHYGIYRNVYVRQFRNTSLTQGVGSMVLFTATHLHPTTVDAAWTPPDTYSSIAERQARYAPISVIEKGNSTVGAFGDITFLMEPYVYLEDNYRVVANIADRVSRIEVPVVEEPEPPDHNITAADLPVGTEKVFRETVNGEEQQLRWLRRTENETVVERPDSTTVFHYDEEGGLLWYESDGTRVVYDSPVPDAPYPLVDGKAWSYRVGYNVTIGNNTWTATLDSQNSVVDFEDVLAEDGKTYFCAKVFVQDYEAVDRVEDELTIATTQLIWISEEVGLVKAETNVDYKIDGWDAMQEERSLILLSIELGEDGAAISVRGEGSGALLRALRDYS